MSDSLEPRKVFLSYTHDEEDTARAISDALTDAGIVAYQSDIEPGDDWRRSLQASVADADSYVVLIGEDATRADRIEWQAVLESLWSDPDKAIVPVLIDNAQSPPAFADREPVQIEHKPNDDDTLVDADVQAVVSKLLAALQRGPHRSGMEPEIQNEFAERLEAIGELGRLLQGEADQ